MAVAELAATEAVEKPEDLGRRVQGNWKRTPGVATRYELQLAIDRLLARGKVQIVDGLLKLAGKPATEPTTRLTGDEAKRAEWARKDAEVRAMWSSVHINESKSTKPNQDHAELAAAAALEAGTMRAEPRSVGKYVLRELRQAGQLGYEALIDAVFDRGGLEWVLEDEPALRVVGKGKGKKRR